MTGPDTTDIVDPTADPTGASDPTPEHSPLLDRVVATVQGKGRLARTDWDLQTVEISGDGDAEPTMAVVLPFARRVVLYAVRPRPVPAEQIPAVAELVLRLNTLLHTSCWELDVDSGLLSVRAGFEFDSVEDLAPQQQAQIIWNCLLEVEIVAEQHGPAVDAVLAGTPPRAAVDALG